MNGDALLSSRAQRLISLQRAGKKRDGKEAAPVEKIPYRSRLRSALHIVDGISCDHFPERKRNCHDGPVSEGVAAD